MQRATRLLTRYAGLIVLGILLPAVAAAAWPGSPLVNVPVCTASGDQTGVVTIPDGAGGVILTWLDQRGGQYGIYAQRDLGGRGPSVDRGRRCYPHIDRREWRVHRFGRRWRRDLRVARISGTATLTSMRSGFQRMERCSGTPTVLR